VVDADACHDALQRLADSLNDVHPELRAKHVPRRTVSCTISDLEVIFVGRVDEHGVHDLDRSASVAPPADVKIALGSDTLLALAAGEDDIVHAWLKGRVQVSAPVRDILRLRSLLGL
jgi:hypothetical protein